MAHLIDKDALVAEIDKRIALLENNSDGVISMLASGMFIKEYKDLLSFLDTLEVKEVGKEETKWSPSKKQMESLKDMLKYNIGMFNYQKWMEVNTLYDNLTKILDYETDR